MHALVPLRPHGRRISYTPITSAQAPVHEWSAKEVKTWAKGKNLPKAVCKRLGQLSGKVWLHAEHHATQWLLEARAAPKPVMLSHKATCTWPAGPMHF